MRYTVSQINSSLLSKVGGKALTQVPNIYSLFYEAGARMQSQVDLASSIRTYPLINPLYANSSLVLLPKDFEQDGFISMNQQGLSGGDYYPAFSNATQNGLEQLDGSTAIIDYNGRQYLQTGLALPTPIIIDSMEALGSWTAIGTTNNVRLDTSFPAQGTGDVAFDLGVGATNGIQNTAVSPINLSTVSNLFFWLDMPVVAPTVTGIRLTVGSDTSSYYQQTITAGYTSFPLVIGYNLLQMTLPSATATGTPNLSAITYVKVEILGNMTTTQTGFRLDAITAIPTGAVFPNVTYYSSYLWEDQYGNRLLMPSAPTDKFIASTDEYNLFLLQMNEILNVDLRPAGANTNIQVYGGQGLQAMYEKYQNKHPSRKIPQRSDVGSGRYGLFPGNVDYYNGLSGY